MKGKGAVTLQKLTCELRQMCSTTHANIPALQVLGDRSGRIYEAGI